MKKKEKVITITNPKDFQKISDLKDTKELILVIKNDLDFNGIKIIPIAAENINVTIKGNGFSIINLTIDKGNTPCTGLFSEVKSLKVLDLNVLDYNIKGGVHTGSLAGKVDKDVLITNSNFKGNINCEAYGGGVVGSCDELVLNKSSFDTTIKGYDIIGGVSGMVSSALINEVTLKVDSKAVGKAKGGIAGYNSALESERIAAMTREAMRHLPPICTNEEMKKLELMLKRKR